MSIPFPDIGIRHLLFLSTHLPTPMPFLVLGEVRCVFWYLEDSALVLKQKSPAIPSGKAAQRLDKLLGGRRRTSLISRRFLQYLETRQLVSR